MPKLDAEFYKILDGVLAEIVDKDQEKESMQLIKILIQLSQQNNLGKTDPSSFSRVKEALLKAKFIAIPLLAEYDILPLVKESILTIFELPDFDLQQKFRKFLLKIDVEKRDGIKNKIKEALLKNEQNVTEKNFSLNNVPAKPTVANWLKLYNATLGTVVVDKLKLTQFLTNNEALKNLKKEEKDKLVMIFSFYEKLKLSSLAKEGLEESFVAILPNGEINFWSEGKLNKANPEVIRILKEIQEKEKNQSSSKIELSQLQELVAKYPVGSLERKVIDEEIKRLSK